MFYEYLSSNTIVWPGDYIEVQLPSTETPDTILALEPRSDCVNTNGSWPTPQIIDAIDGKIRILNDSGIPQKLGKHDHFCQVLPTIPMVLNNVVSEPTLCEPVCIEKSSSKNIDMDPDNILPNDIKVQFHSLHTLYESVFNGDISGYNGACGLFEAKVNMGPTLPPQRKGRVPQYARDKLVELQAKFDDLEEKGVFARPEDVDVSVEYLNPSFLVKKAQGGYRLVTAFSEVARYSKPQPSLMPDVDTILRTIAPWKYLIVTDLTSAFYQIPLSKDSMKYCGVVTPFKGVRVYTRTAMGMPGSETALEEVMCRVLGECLEDGIVAKLADDLYCGADTLSALFENWKRVLTALDKANLKLSPTKTIICPTTTTILGWTWSNGTLSASKHKLSALCTCTTPETVKGLRSFIGAYKILGRVIPNTSRYLSQLEDAIAGRPGQDKISWSDELHNQFTAAQKALLNHKSIVLPRPDDQIWIVTDGSVVQRGIGATMYVTRNNSLHLAGFFSAKLRKHQVTGLPCEIEALSINAAVKHFSPYIIQSKCQTCVLTDSLPCVRSIERLCRGEFSSSPRVTSFLSTVSRYGVNLRHLAGSVNLPSDFASRNAPECTSQNCQICKFIIETEDSVVRALYGANTAASGLQLPYASRSAWKDIQQSCPDLRRVHAHLRQGTRPSKKLTNVRDVKRYLNDVSISRDNILVVTRTDPLVSPVDLIVVPRSIADGLVTALHIKLDHPSKHQLVLAVKRQFHLLDLVQVVDRVHNACNVCASLKSVPKTIIEQSSEEAPEIVGASFAVDVLRRSKQMILVLRETVSSLTKSCIIDNERAETLRSALLSLMVELHPLDGPMAVVRCDPAPGFIALQQDDVLRRYRVVLDVGRVKNPNKNPVAEKAILELESEIVRQEPGGHPLTPLQLATATARLNSRIRHAGLSSREIWTQRSQFTNEQIPLSDRELILKQHDNRLANHQFSAKSKCKSDTSNAVPNISVGDLVYLYSDRKKHQCRDRYLVVSVDSANQWCFIKKFIGNQLRALSYKVKISECYHVPCQSSVESRVPLCHNSVDSDSEDLPVTHPYPPSTQVFVPPTLTQPSVEMESQIPTQQDLTSYDNPQEAEALVPVLDLPEGPCSQHVSRPQRARKQPKHLSDYVLR
ncbi:hypothetical protein DPMN_037803 [Dreissena polymorpha]|uniref:Uncharacterized protein n=1 Tax=Dreissena polymorpha TaxID=45954 RepID=A0A9D4MFR9_DREPO|nr:hypothetical protein DPMN_037803 [Dreissena polymorpha]